MSAKRFGMASMVAFALLASAAVKAGESYLAKGMYEANFGASYTNLEVDDFDVHMLTGQGDLAYFLTDEISLGLGVMGAYLMDAGDVDDDGYLIGTELKLRYHFPAINCMVPYVGIHGGYVYMDAAGADDDGWSYGAHAGVKFPITANVFFDTQLRYTWVNLDDTDVDMELLQVVAGVSYYFGEGANVQFGGSAEPGPYEAGDMEFGFAGTYTYAKIEPDGADDESTDANVFYAQGKAAYFVTDTVSVGLAATGLYMPEASDVADDVLLIGGELSADYNFAGLGRIVPYLGLHGGYAYAEAGGMEYLWTYGAHGGAKYLITDSVFVDAQLRYTEYDYSNDDVDVDIDTIQVLVGLGFRL